MDARSCRNAGLLALLALTASQPATAELAGSADPALQLKSFFVDSYVHRGIERGADAGQATTEANCMFEVMAQNLTLGQYISMSAISASGGSAKTLIPDKVFKKMQSCVSKT